MAEHAKGIGRRRLLKGAAAAAGGATVLGGAGAVIAAPGKAAEAAGTAFGPTTVTADQHQYADLVRGVNQRFVGSPESVRVVGATGQVADVVKEA
ncbi:FAD-linked oxidase, partial [Streptomyces sp. NPDC047097]